MKRMILLVTLLSAVCSYLQPAKACLWDYDTVQIEAVGLPKVVHAIIGHFPRNPPLFFEMRLERNAKLIAENPDDPTLLEAYDNCAVACDRLGRMDEAIEWMKKKKVVLDQLDPNDPTYIEHQYRYLANLGTHHIHRWLKNGRPTDDLSDINRSIELLTAAIALNPDAHFGREKFQLDIITSLRKGYGTGTTQPSLSPTSFLPEEVHNALNTDKNDQFNDEIEALIGIITLGAAWESSLMYDLLSHYLSASGDSYLALFAYFRAREIETTRATRDDDNSRPETYHIYVASEKWSALEKEFESYREQANQYQEDRLVFMNKKLQAGEHPDIHPQFFSGEGARFTPASFADEDVMRSYVGAPGLINSNRLNDPQTLIFIASIICPAIPLLVIALIIFVIIRAVRRKIALR